MSNRHRLEDYYPEEEDYSLVDQVEGQDQEEEEEEEIQHPRPSASSFRDSDDRIQHHVSNSAKKNKRAKPISFEVRMVYNIEVSSSWSWSWSWMYPLYVELVEVAADRADRRPTTSL